MTVLDRGRDFFDFDGWTYLNCSFHGPLPRVAEEALAAAVDLRKNPARMRNEYHFTLPDAYREAVGGLIGCAPADIAVTDSTTHGVMLLVGGLDWQAGDEVVIPRGEFPANKLPWLALEERGVVVHQIDLGAGWDAAERIEAALTPRTRVVSLSWVSFTDGRRLDLAPISRLCRERGVLFVVDGSQGIGGLPFDLRETPADLVACSGYKWLLGPYGLGFAYVERGLAERLRPTNVNWFSVEGAEDFNRLAELPYTFRPGAHRFDLNETGNFFNLAPGIAALNYVAEIGPAAIEAHCRALHDRLVAGLPSGYSPLGEAGGSGLRSNILCVVGPDAAATAAAFRRLRDRRVAVSSRESSIRVSPHVYNGAAAVDRFLEVLWEAAGHRPRRARAAAPLPVGESVSPTAAQRPQRRVLAGEQVALHPLDPERHLEDLYAASHGTPEKEAVWTYMPSGPFAEQEAMGAWAADAAASKDPLYFAVLDRPTGKAIGVASYLRIVPEHRSIELGHIWYTPSAQQTGVNTEAIYLLLREAFGTLGYRRVEWKCDTFNARSRRAALRLGFRFEGVFRRHMVVKGRSRDTAWFAMLDSEWPAVERRVARWLARPAGERGSLSPGGGIDERLRRLLRLPSPGFDPSRLESTP